MSDCEKTLAATVDRTVTLSDEASSARRKLLKGSSLAVAGAALYGVAPFMGPWKHNHLWAQTGQKNRLLSV